MKYSLLFAGAFFCTNLATGQCPTFSSSSLSSPDCFSGNTSCDLCVDDEFVLNVTGSGLPDGGCVEWYYDDAASFNPFNGQGTLIGCGSITSDDPCTVCMSIEAILVHTIGGQSNEFIIFNSGGGFNTDDFVMDFDINNNGIPPIPSVEDIGISTSCPLQIPTTSLLGCPSAIPVTSGTFIPQNALVVLFTDNTVTFDYDFSALCATGAPIYILQSSCDRILGAFTDSPSSPRTQSIVNSDCGCSGTVTYTGSFSNSDGDYVLGDGSFGNSGTSAPPVSWTPGSLIISSVDPVTFQVTESMCNGGPYYVKGISVPLSGSCPNFTTQTHEFDVICPEAMITGDNEICVGQDADLEGSGGDDYDWVHGPNTAIITVSPLVTTTYELTVSIGICEDVTDFEVEVTPLNTPSLSTHSLCEDDPNYDLINLTDPSYSTGDWSGDGVSFNQFDPSGFGGQTVTLTFDSDEDCVDDATTTIEVDELEIPILSTQTLCESDPILDLTTLADPNYPFGDWSGTGVTGEDFDPTGLGGQIISLQFDPDDDCVDIEFTDITVNVSATPTLGTTTLCDSDPLFDLTILADPLFTAGTWSGTGVSGNEFNPTGLGGQTITLTFDPTDDCVNNQTTTINVNSAATPTLGSETLCEFTTAFDLTTLQDPLFPTGNWSGTGVTGSTFDATGLGGQTITLTFASSANCVNNETTTIMVTSVSTPTLGSTTLCETDASFDLNGLVDPLFPTGNWSGTGVTGSTFDATGLGGQTITLTFASSANCVNNETTTIMVTSASTPTLGSTTLCETDTNFDLNGLVDPLFSTGSWSGTGVTGSTFDATGLGGQTITLTFASSANCVNNETTTIMVTSASTPTLGSTTLCETDASFDLNGLVDPFFPTGSWSGTGVTGSTFDATGLGGQTINLTFDPMADCVNNQTTTITVQFQISYSNLSVSCNNSNTKYVVSFEIGGGVLANYSITLGSGNISGTTFTSDSIAAGDPYHFIISDGSSCSPIDIEDTPNCGCSTRAGSLSTPASTPVFLCENEMATFAPSTGSFLDANDVLVYVLYEGTNVATGTIIATNSVPEFTFMPGTMSLNTTYFIIAIAGDDNGSGFVNPLDPCFSFSNTIPIRFTPNPIAMFLSDSAFVCDGGTMVDLNFSGTAPFQYQLSINGTPGNVETTMTSTISLPFSTTTSIELLQFEDAICAGTITNSMAEVVVYPPIQITVLDTIYFPDNTISLVLEITGGEDSNNNFTQNGGTLNGQIFTTDPVACDTPIEVCASGILCPQVCYQTVINCQSTNCTSDSGVMDNMVQNVCFGDTLNFSSVGTILDADDLHCYVLHDNSGDFLGTMFSIYETEELFYTSSLTFGTTYYLSSVVGNNNGNDLVDFDDPCLSVSIGTPIVFRDLPSASLPNDFTVCKDEVTDIEISLSGNAPFNFIYQKDNAAQPTVNTSLTHFNIQENFNQSSQIIISTLSDNYCSNENLDTINIDLFPYFSIEDFKIECDPMTQMFQVSFLIMGGLLNTFQVEGGMGTLAGNAFESGPIASNDSFEFLIFDGNNCDTLVRSGTQNCSCSTNAGTLQTFPNTMLICGDDEVSVTHNGDEVLEPDDALQFVLHDEPGLTLGNILDINDTGIFSYNNGLVYGQTYFISTIAGSSSSGTIDLNDDCLNISLGNPIVFQPEPTVDVVIGDRICEGDSILVDLNFTGIAPYQTYYSIVSNGSTDNQSFIATGNNFEQLIGTPTGVNQFEIRIDSIESQGCSADVMRAQTISILQPQRYLLNQTLCTGDSIIVDGTVYNEANPNDLINLENGAMNGCDSIIEINLQFDAAIMVDFRDTICQDETIEINGTEYNQMNPSGIETIKTPGQCDSIFNIELAFLPTISIELLGGETICKGDTAYLEVSLIGIPMVNFTVSPDQGSNIPFREVIDGDLLPVVPDVTTSYEIFAVSVNPNNCDIMTSSTPVLIEVSDLGFDIQMSDNQGFNVSCFGGTDGLILVNPVGGVMPVSIIWEDGSVGFERQNLPVGDYDFKISDAVGCSDSLTILLTAPNEIVPEIFAENGDCLGGQEATLEVTSIIGGVPPFEIFLNNQSQGIGSTLPAIFSNIDDGSNQIRIVDANDCLFEDNFEITSGGSSPMVDLGSDTTIVLGDEIQINASTNITPDSIVWTTTTALSCDNCLNPIAQPQSDIRLEISIYDENGCSATDDILIKVLKTTSIFIPNAFSPNNDGINDRFIIFSDSKAVKINLFSIYDRWGNNVFQGIDLPLNEPASGWDGKFKGNTLNSGVYVFFAEIEFLDGSTEIFEGEVTLY